MRAESVLTLREPLARYVDFISLTQRTLLLVLWFHCCVMGSLTSARTRV